MVRAWYMDDVAGDQRKPHMTDPPQFVSLEQLKDLGVLYFEVNISKLYRPTLFSIYQSYARPRDRGIYDMV